MTPERMYQTEDKIYEVGALKTRLVQWRLKDNIIVFTNGCFDILHPGHIDYLEKAKSLGTKLVVGLNSDASVKRLKGEPRPYFSEKDRAKMLAALEFVNAVVIFEEDTPEQLIRELVPEVLVKGADYEEAEIVGGDFVKEKGGKVERIPFLEGYSTSALVRKIQNT